MYWDKEILLFAATHRSEILDAFFRGITWLGSLYILVPLTLLSAALLGYWQKRLEAGLLLVGLGGATLLVHILKLALARPRPMLGERLVPLPWDSSFPSAHTTQITAFILCMVLVIHRLWPQGWILAATIAAVLILLVGASRIYLQVHYPTDVLAGMLLAGIWIALTQRIF